MGLRYGSAAYTWSVCQDDRCEIPEEHPRHLIVETDRAERVRQKRLGWKRHPFEPCAVAYSQSYEAPEVLASCVLEVCSRAIPKSKGMIQTDVAGVYGDVCDRRLFRVLARLAQSGQLLRFDLSSFNRGGSLNAYLLPGGSIRHDPQSMYELLTDQFDAWTSWL